jgi:hypothetical protein
MVGRRAVLALAALVSACAGETSDDVDTAEAPLVNVAEAQKILFLDAQPPPACANGTPKERIECLITARYASDPSARLVALAYFRERGGIAGVSPKEIYDGGYRGRIQFVPELPVGAYRKHLIWTTDAAQDVDTFFTTIERSANTPLAYRWREVHLRFFRSVGRTTPSAQVNDSQWALVYNVSGSLNSSASAVRETFFHELFHLNDFAHNDWSIRVIAPIISQIIARCGSNPSCFDPYTPTDVKVGGGMYYAFQPGPPTGIEYAAELSIRYQTEQQARIEGRALSKPAFKCGKPENAQTWKLMVDEFFGGVDYVPPCP